MKGTMPLLTISAALLTASLASLPSFDWRAAVFVGFIVAVGAAVVIAAAIATPAIGIVAGAGIIKTALEIGAIAVVTGVIGGIAAGFYWGWQGDIKRREQIESIKRVSNQLDIYFEPSSEDPRRASDFQCTLVFYEETDLASRPPIITDRKVKIVAADSQEFYGQVDQQMKSWFDKQVLGDADGQKRRVVIYMNPYPGQGVYERIKQLAENNGIRKCIVNKVEAEWQSALPK